MDSRRDLEVRLQRCRGFTDPAVDKEQYPTPADLASHLVHAADLHGDFEGRVVLDLGTGTGILALGAATRGPDRVIGLELDRAALTVARENRQRIAGETDLAPVTWVLGDATRPPLCPTEPVTVLSNPPFGAQRGRRHADRAFLEAIAALPQATSYTIHNAGSHDFVASFAGDNGGRVTHAWAGELDLDRQFPFHEAATRTIDVEILRIEWARSERGT